MDFNNKVLPSISCLAEKLKHYSAVSIPANTTAESSSLNDVHIKSESSTTTSSAPPASNTLVPSASSEPSSSTLTQPQPSTSSFSSLLHEALTVPGFLQAAAAAAAAPNPKQPPAQTRSVATSTRIRYISEKAVQTFRYVYRVDRRTQTRSIQKPRTYSMRLQTARLTSDQIRTLIERYFPNSQLLTLNSDQFKRLLTGNINMNSVLPIEDEECTETAVKEEPSSP